MADTIFAQATPPGRSGVAVVRISGPEARGLAARLGADRLIPRRATVRRLIRPEDCAPLDDALVLWFPGPKSFTGEDVVEFHLHGGRAVCRAVLDAIARHPGLRAADAGEFTRRALLNGKLDLTQVEGLGDLLTAETEAQARQAMRSIDGALARSSEAWRDRLIQMLGLIEATIDFADEDLPDDLVAASVVEMTDLLREWRQEIERCDAAERLREGFEVALVGRPNVGKSTLLNALAGREAAITSEVPGTTRDPIEVAMDVRGLPVTFVDLAGLRESDDVVESIGVARARSRMDRADLRVVLLGSGDRLEELLKSPSDDDIVLRAKSDLGLPPGLGGVSGLTGEGVEALLERIHETLVERVSGVGVLTHARHKAVLADGCVRLATALQGLRSEGAIELVAEDVRAAIQAVDKLVGKVDIEDVLGSIFGRFCIGK